MKLVFAEVRSRAQRAIVYPLTRDECLWLCDLIDQLETMKTTDDWLLHRLTQSDAALRQAEQEAGRLRDALERIAEWDEDGEDVEEIARVALGSATRPEGEA